MSYQKLIIQGNIGNIHEARYLTNGDMVLNFSVAYSEGKDKPTTWFNCTAFRKTAEFMQQWFKKGDSIIVEGRIKCEKYQAKDGTEKEAWKVDVDKVAFAGGKKSEADPETTSNPAPAAKPASSFDNMDDDIPF